MDPITLILAALAAGAAAAGKDVVSSAVKDAYNGLKNLLVSKIRDHAENRSADAVEVDPSQVLEAHSLDPENGRGPVEDMLRKSHVDQDGQVLSAAEDLLASVDPVGAGAGKYRIDLRGAQGVQVGDRGHMTVNFGRATPDP